MDASTIAVRCGLARALCFCASGAIVRTIATIRDAEQSAIGDLAAVWSVSSF